MLIQSIGFVGHGKFGQFLVVRCNDATNLRVDTWDPADNDSEEQLETVLSCDAVVFTVPPKEYEKVLRAMVPRMGRNAVIVDVCTVKMHTVGILREIANGRHYIASHPMFGFQSFLDQGRSLKGLQVIICEHTLAPDD